ncbi:hypothetical protein [Streptomyces spiralis]|uniref:hypothetical protein n=1 Tax=Streptomyces spiralis TaxID=66376 RepID=UPI0036CF1A2C
MRGEFVGESGETDQSGESGQNGEVGEVGGALAVAVFGALISASAGFEHVLRVSLRMELPRQPDDVDCLDHLTDTEYAGPRIRDLS